MMTSLIQYNFLFGTGFDVHALEALDHDHRMMLCGVPVPCRYQVIAHSDGDVGLHALVDAILGAIAAGDIGEHFSPSDERWKNADSTVFVSHALQLCAHANAIIVNADITLIAEHPKISLYKLAMRKRIAALLHVPIERVSVKATTTERLGFLGRSEGIAAQAAVSIKIPAKE